MRSIMQEKDGTCYICKMLEHDYSQKLTQEHHVFFGTANRKMSEKYGLKVYLCLNHHTSGKNAVHQNREISDRLKEKAQITFQKKFPELNFREIFGKNYIMHEQEEKKKNEGPGIIWME